MRECYSGQGTENAPGVEAPGDQDAAHKGGVVIEINRRERQARRLRLDPHHRRKQHGCARQKKGFQRALAGHKVHASRRRRCPPPKLCRAAQSRSKWLDSFLRGWKIEAESQEPLTPLGLK